MKTKTMKTKTMKTKTLKKKIKKKRTKRKRQLQCLLDFRLLSFVFWRWSFCGCGRCWAWNWRWHFAAVSLSNFSDTLAVQIIPETWARRSGQHPGCLRSPSGIQQLYASSVFQRSRLSPNYARRERALGRGRFLAASHDALQVLDSQSVCHGEESFSKNLFVN